MKCRKTRPVSNDDSNMLTGFGLATIKMEGGIADPDEFEWECSCQECQDKYDKWKAEFTAQQKELS